MEKFADKSVVVLGAGVIGLTIAYVLSEDPANRITIVARDLPTNLDSQVSIGFVIQSDWM